MQGGKGGLFESNANIVVNGRIVGSGYIINGVTYDQYGNRPPNNAIITDKRGKEIGRMPGAPPVIQPPKSSSNVGQSNQNTNNTNSNNNPAPTNSTIIHDYHKDMDWRDITRVQVWLNELTYKNGNKDVP